MPSEPKFDRYQFDPAMRPGSYANELLTFRQESLFGEEALDPNDEIGIVKERRTTRPDSEQFSDQAFVKIVLLAAFPKLETNKAQRARAKRWLKIMYLYWQLGAPISHLVEAVYGTTLNARDEKKKTESVKRIIKRIRGKARQCTEAV